MHIRFRLKEKFIQFKRLDRVNDPNPNPNILHIIRPVTILMKF